MSAPVFKAWYSVVEAAELMSVTPQHLNGLIRKGQRTNPPADAIGPEFTRMVGDKRLISRRYVFPDEPVNVTAFPVQYPDKQIEEMTTRIVARVLGALSESLTFNERSA